MELVIQIAGSLLVLAAFTLGQFGRLSVTSPRYLLLNAVGSTALAIDAAVTAQWGFLLLEGVWAVVSWYGLARWGARRGSPDGATGR